MLSSVALNHRERRSTLEASGFFLPFQHFDKLCENNRTYVLHNIFQFFITALKGAILTKNGEVGENGESPKKLPERWEI